MHQKSSKCDQRQSKKNVAWSSVKAYSEKEQQDQGK